MVSEGVHEAMKVGAARWWMAIVLRGHMCAPIRAICRKLRGPPESPDLLSSEGALSTSFYRVDESCS
jgi:hypothetical protein